jgi:type VI secretion system FHA domain protein
MLLKLQLVHSGNPNVVSVQDCNKDIWTVGRGNQNDLPLPDPEKWVSNRHAQFQRMGGAWYLMDVGSTNGTFVNDQRLPANEPRSLSHGDRVSLGPYTLTVELVFEQTASGDPARPKPPEPDPVPERPAGPDPDRTGKPAQPRPGGPQTVEQEPPPKEPRKKEPRQPRPVDQQSRPPRQARPPVELTPEALAALEPAALKALSSLAGSLLGDAQLQTPAEVEQFGSLLREVVSCLLEFLVRSLASRKEFENQFSAEMTMMLKLKANPLKTAPDPSEMARRLLDWRDGVLPADARRHLESACRDLSLHQLGLFSGVEEAVRTILRKLDPKEIEKQAGGGGFLGKRAWETFVALHGDLENENQRLFNDVIFPGLRKGYVDAHKDQKPDT